MFGYKGRLWPLFIKRCLFAIKCQSFVEIHLVLHLLLVQAAMFDYWLMERLKRVLAVCFCVT
jgi:hypothetical protein